MSAGKFKRGIYVSNDGVAYRCRYQPETEGLMLGGEPNEAQNATSTSELTVKLRRSKRPGFYSRLVRIEFAPGAPIPRGYSGGQLLVPVLGKTAFDEAVVGGPAEYLGVPCVVVSKMDEVFK